MEQISWTKKSLKDDKVNIELSMEMRELLDERLKECKKTYISSEDSIKKLNEKYGL